MTLKTNHTASFDHAAKNYDDTFTRSSIGILQRKRVYHWLKKIEFFNVKRNVFEINCGTGYDAEQFHLKGHLVTATDISGEMIAYAQKVRTKEVKFMPLGFDQVAENNLFKSSNVLFSNFGGLNCMSHSEMKSFTNRIAAQQQPGDWIIWVILPKFCGMETLYFFFRLEWKKMFRRNTDQAVEVNVDGMPVKMWYHAPRQIKSILKNNYHIQLVKPIALFLPPSYLEPYFKNRPGFLHFLDRLERFWGNLSFFAGWADHYIIAAKKK